jgi:hypothetical protein
LWEPSDEWSSRCTPGMLPIAFASRSTTSARLPSLMLGMHSMIGIRRVVPQLHTAFFELTEDVASAHNRGVCRRRSDVQASGGPSTRRAATRHASKKT